MSIVTYRNKLTEEQKRLVSETALHTLETWFRKYMDGFPIELRERIENIQKEIGDFDSSYGTTPYMVRYILVQIRLLQKLKKTK